MPGPIKVFLSRTSGSKGLVKLVGPGEETEEHGFTLPWLDETVWEAVFLSLELYEEDRQTWPQGQARTKAEELGLFLKDKDRPSSKRFEIIGRELYYTLFGSERIRHLLDRLLHTEYDPVLVFRIQDEGGVLQSYPWELLHDDRDFLFRERRAFLVRHVDLGERVPPLDLTEKLRVLYIAPRPSILGYTGLPSSEELHLEYLNNYYPDHLVLESPLSNTLDGLHTFLMERSPVPVVHVDTHGGYGWLCQCGSLVPPGVKQCYQCNGIRSRDQKVQGYLAFETSEGEIVWVDGDQFGRRLYGRGVRMVVLSACRSGLVGGSSTFNSVAGALIKRGIPSVVAMQFSIEVEQAEKFVEYFYRAILTGMPLTEAMAEVRIALSDDSWYRPVLYLRTEEADYRGEILKFKLDEPLPSEPSVRDRWRARLGFRRDPFLYTDGGDDPYLHEYFHRGMKHFDKVYGHPSRPAPVFVFGPPGSGKSSMRNVITQISLGRGILPIVYKDFGPLVYKAQKGQGVQVEDHVKQLLKTALRTLGDLANKGIVSVPSSKDNSTKDSDRNEIIRNHLWLYVRKYEEDPSRRDTLKDLLEPDQEVAGELPPDPRELLGRFCRYVTELFKYRFIYILVDPDHDIASDEEIAWRVLEPLLSTGRLLKLGEDQVAFKFFLGQRFLSRARQIPWIEREWLKRVCILEWSDEELRDLLRERLLLCSKGRYESLGQLSEVEGLDEQVIRLAGGSPRQLIVICNELFEEHSRQWSPEKDEPALITAQEVGEVLEPFKEQYKSELERLVDQREGEKVELKSTMRYNLKAGRRDKSMDEAVARTLCAFLNTNGGTLIIGVSDEGEPLGLEADFSTLRKKDQDGFEQAFTELVSTYLGMSVQQYIRPHFDEYQGELVYVVEVDPSPRPVFCSIGGEDKFYIRFLNTTRELSGPDLLNYCREHFDD